MILLIDVGNTRFKWAYSDGSSVHTARSEPHHGDPARLFYTLALPPADAVWVAQVVGAEHEAKLQKALRAHFGHEPHFARTLEHCEGLHVGYAEPERLGVDRWLAMLALWLEQPHAFCVVNAGTALTFDAVNDAGEHVGGLIAPGLVTAEKAVLDATRFATRPKDIRYGSGLGRDTESCVRQGALHACAGLIERAARHSHGARFISGGDAAALLPHIGGARATPAGPGWNWRPHLIFEGLLALSRLG